MTSTDDIVAKITRKNPSLRCVMCGQTQFELIDQPERNQLTRINLYKEGASLPNAEVGTARIACSNCGFVHTFLLQILDR